MEFKCPICRKAVLPEQPQQPSGKEHGTKSPFPFCSERCKLIDIGAWLDAKYRIAAESDYDEGDSMEGDQTNDNGSPAGG